jgi:hypothetical protein
LIVPQGQAVHNILNTAQDQITTGGHLGINKVKSKIRKRFYWPGWSQDIIEYLTTCQVCQQIKALHYPKKAPLSII